MLVGEGKVGKTSLCNSMIGKRFQETEPIVEFTQLTCDVGRDAGICNGRWSERPSKSKREFETGFVTESQQQLSAEALSKQKEAITYDNSQTLKSDGDERDLDVFNTGDVTFSATLHANAAEPANAAAQEVSSFSKSTSMEAHLIDPDVNSVTDGDLILSLLDIGGQSVFNIIHHFFLASNRVYVVVFNMVDVLDDQKKEKSLSDLSFWINSIAMHTCVAESNEIASVFLVGTHQDEVFDLTNHDFISKVLSERFQQNIAWPSVVQNGNLFFFPIKNICSQQDDFLMNLMKNIEDKIKESDYVKQPRPLLWLKVLDELIGTEKKILTLNEASSIATANAVKEEDVPYLLKFLNEMGVVLWLDEEGLRDVVILDIITFFVEPATLILRNHIAKTSEGTVAREAINFLWKDHVDADNIPLVLSIMLRFGLIVKSESPHKSSQSTEKYLVPALLSTTKNDPRGFSGSMHFKSCYFAFSTMSDFTSKEMLIQKQLEDECFLPRGLVERLIAKAVKWCNSEDITTIRGNQQLYGNYAVLSNGHQIFRLVYISELNCIRLDVEGLHPLPVYNKVNKLIDLCLKECMGSLKFIHAFQLSESVETFTLVNLTSGKGAKVNNAYSSWLNDKNALPSYDIFISHRWNKDDNKVIDKLCDAFRDHKVGPENRAVKVFLDKDILKKGHQFQCEYGKALVQSTILVPILSTAVLRKMTDHNPEEQDNVLIQWILALECMQDPTHSKMREIHPLMIREWTADGSTWKRFTEEILEVLPDVVPVASINVVKTLLKENGVAESSFISKRTVHCVVEDILKLSVGAQKDFSPLEAAEQIIAKLNHGVLNIC